MKFFLLKSIYFLGFCLFFRCFFIQIKITSLTNFHCISNNEELCDPYYIITFPSDNIKNFSPAKQCTRSPIYKESLLFNPQIIDNNQITIEFLQYPFKNSSYTTIPKEIMAFSLENIPSGETTHYLMLKTINNEKKTYLLPSCVRIELNNDISNRQIDNKLIKGVTYCKEEFSHLFYQDENLSCKDKKQGFTMNKMIEMKAYAMILECYKDNIEKNERNLVFLLNYRQFLRYNEWIFGRGIREIFEKSMRKYPEISKYFNDLDNYIISLEENTNYLNDIVYDYLEDKKGFLNEKNKNDLLNFKEIMNVLNNTNNLTEFKGNITVITNFTKDFCPNKSICILNSDLMGLLSENIVEEYLNEESNFLFFISIFYK